MYILNATQVLFVGDPHLDFKTPKSRKDDFAKASLDKLIYVMDYAVNNSIKCVIFLGDVFSRKISANEGYLCSVIEILRKAKDRGVLILSIVGNHDFANNRMETLVEHPLGILFASGVVYRLDALCLILDETSCVFIKGFDYKSKLLSKEFVCSDLKFPSSVVCNICVAHLFYNSSFDPDTITKSQVASLDYDIYVLGHDHQVFPPCQVGKSIVYRCSSLTRGTSHLYNLERNVYVDLISFIKKEDNTFNCNFERLSVPCKSADEVFLSETLISKNIETKDDYSMKIKYFLSMIDSGESNDTIESYLNNMQLKEEVKLNVETYLRNALII